MLTAAACVAALLLTGAVVHAQTDAPAQTPDSHGGEPAWYGGAHILFTNANIGASRDYDPRFGLGAGVYVGRTVWKAIDLRAGADIVQKGADLSVGNWSIEWQLDYLEIPVLLVYNFQPRSRTSFEIVAGGSYGFGIHQQIEEGDNLGYDLEEMKGLLIPLEHVYMNVDGTLVPRSAVVIDDVATTELTAILGFGLSTPVGGVNLCFDARYEIGLTDPAVSATFQQVVGSGEEAGFATTREEFSNKAFCFFIGFEFPFGARTVSE
ncbi:MAG TPA: outer membrane beta-barrel protein [Candidatus Krumholzibacteria bacterium]